MVSWIRRLAGICLTLSLAAQAEATSPIVVFAASSMKESIESVSARYTEETGQQVVVSLAGSATLARQIEQGAPADLVLTADAEWMDWLSAQNLIVSTSRVNLLSNELAVIAPSARVGKPIAWSELPAWFANLPTDERVALAQTDTVPAGKYAKAALQALQLWPALAARRVETENVRAALLLVAREEAAWGIVYRTDALVEPRVAILARVPSEQHPAIVYPLAQVRASKHPHAAQLLAWLQSPAAMALFQQYGFLRP